MNTQVSIKVKNASIISRCMSLLWFINIFKKMSVDAYIDSQDAKPMRLKARSDPYVIDLTPGVHTIAFVDPQAGMKKMTRWMTGAFIGFSAGLSGSMNGAMVAGSSLGDAFAGNTIRENGVQFSLNEGDVLKIQVQPKSSGSVKIKFLK